MIDYKLCNDVELDKVYEAFKIGFSDYMIKLEMSREDFVKRFLGPEGNQLQHSHIALDGEVPIGVILGGLKQYEGVKTLRCGALCIHPEYRGVGVSQRLFELHKEIALENQCKQMFLEVIVGNDRAIKFYNKLGYSKVYDLSYFTHTEIKELKTTMEAADINIKKINFETLSSLADKIIDTHINWQNDLDYISKLEGINHYGAYKDSQLVGALSISPTGKIFFIWTLANMRHQGVARKNIIFAAVELGLEKLAISFPNNSKLEGFVLHNGFNRDKICQYEMYLTL